MIIKLVGKLIAPLGYLRIKHEEKPWVDFYLPFIIALLLTFVFYSLPKPISILGSAGLIHQVNGLLQVLTGFYIAALAAVSTFQAKDMDKLMLGTPPSIIESRGSKNKLVELTRRRFLCYLFGYLALTCFFIFTTGLFINLILSSLGTELSLHSWHQLVRNICLFIYLFCLANMMTVTLFGLYYLTVRIHIGKTERIPNESED